MGLRAILLAALLLPIVGGRPAGASDGDVDLGALLRLLDAREEPARPTLGLLGARDGAYRPAQALEPDPYDRPGREEAEAEAEDGARPTDELMDWIEGVGGVGDGIAADLLRRIAVDIEVRVPGGRVERGCLVAASGHRALFSRTRSVRIVADYSPELACDNSGGFRPSAVGDPIPDTLREGLAVDVRPFLLAGGTQVAIEVALQAGRFEDPVERIDTEARFLGNLDLPRYRGALLFASGTTAVGEPLDVVLERGPTERFDLRLTPRVLDVPAGDSAHGSTVHRIDAGLLVRPPTTVGFEGSPDPFWNPPQHVLPGLAWSEPAARRGTVWRLVLDLLPEAPWLVHEDGSVWLQAPPGDADRLRRTLSEWTAGVARTVRVEITARSGDEVVGRVEVPALTGRNAFFRLGTDRAVILDSGVEVG